MKRSRALHAVVFVDLLGLTLMLPVLPFHVVELGGRGLWLGIVLAAFSAAQAVAAPLLGRLADRCGRRRMLLLSLAGSVTSMALLAGAPNLAVLLVARIVAGACGGSLGVAYALVADRSTPAERTRAMAGLGMAVGAAFTVGPLIGAAGARLGFAAVAVAGAGLAAAALLLAWRQIEDVPGVARPATSPAERMSLMAGPVRVLLGVAFAGMCAMVGLESTVALLAGYRLGAGPGFVGLLLCVAGVAMTVVQIGPLSAGVRRFGDQRVALGSALSMAVALAVLPLVDAVGFVLAVAVVAAGQGLLSTCTTSMLSQLAPPARRGELLGRGQSAAAMGRLVGPVLAGALYDVGAGLPAVAGAVLVAGAALAIGGAAPGLRATMGAIHRSASTTGSPTKDEE